jgi:hypothetical protein
MERMHRRKSDDIIIKKGLEKFDIDELLDGSDLNPAFDNQKSCITSKTMMFGSRSISNQDPFPRSA